MISIIYYHGVNRNSACFIITSLLFVCFFFVIISVEKIKL